MLVGWPLAWVGSLGTVADHKRPPGWAGHIRRVLASFELLGPARAGTFAGRKLPPALPGRIQPVRAGQLPQAEADQGRK